MSLPSDYLMTSKSQFEWREHSSTITYSTLLVEYYVSKNTTVYVLVIGAAKPFDIRCHSKLFELLETCHNLVKTIIV